MSDSHTTSKMGVYEYTLIVGALVLGLVPGVFAYQYLTVHDETLMYVAGATYATHAPVQQLPRAAQSSKPDMVLISRPEKTTDALCPNSYYMTTLVSVSGDTARIQQTCESKRDQGNTWLAATTGWESAGEGESATMGLVVFRDNTDLDGALVELVRDGSLVTVSASEFEGITTATSFLLSGDEVPEAAETKGSEISDDIL